VAGEGISMLVEDNEDSILGELDVVEQLTTPPKIEEDHVVEDTIPEKYKGKSPQEIIKMHQEAEKLIGKQAQEVGEVRKLADELLKQSLSNSKPAATEVEPEIDFFEDPQKAIRNSIDKHPDVLAARQSAQEFKKMQIQQKLNQDHPDFQNIVQDPEFAEWVKQSPVRLGLYAKADGEFDYDSANELLSTYKQLKQIKTQQVATKGKETLKQNLKAVAVDTGGTGESSKRVYRRADLIRLRMSDPDRYEALEPEIMKAYADGRVR
jgi:hypothetical protein